MTYDRTRLTELGQQHKQARAQLDDIRKKLGPEIVAADLSGVPQKDIVEMTGYTREAVRVICLPEGQRPRRKKSES